MKLLKLILLLVLTSTTLFSSIAILKKAELKNGELRLSFDKSYNKSNIRITTLKNPTRILFDIRDARLKNKSVGKNLDSLHCRDIRISQYKNNIVRVVLEVDRAYSCSAYRPMFSYSSYRIPLPKYKSTKKHTKKKNIVTNTKSKNQPIVNNIPYIRKYSHNHKNRGSIVIDAGHGGHDPGAIGGKKKEKDLVLQIAKRLKKELIKRGFTVYMTRDNDSYVKLTQRTKIADRKNAKVFISIHANAVPKRKRNKIHGVETFFLQNTRDAKSQRIAARENKSVLKGAGSKLSKKVIVDSVLNGPKIVQSNKLAIDVQKRMMTNIHTRYKGVKDGGVRHAPFYVLVGASRPSILIEVGYISHPEERKRMFQASYQNLISRGIAEGIENYLSNREKELGL